MFADNFLASSSNFKISSLSCAKIARAPFFSSFCDTVSKLALQRREKERDDCSDLGRRSSSKKGDEEEEGIANVYTAFGRPLLTVKGRACEREKGTNLERERTETTLGGGA